MSACSTPLVDETYEVGGNNRSVGESETATERGSALPGQWPFYAIAALGIASAVGLAWDVSIPPPWYALVLLTAAAVLTDIALKPARRTQRPHLSAPFLLAAILILPPPATLMLVATVRLATWLRSEAGWRELAVDSAITVISVASAYLSVSLLGLFGFTSGGPGLLAQAALASAILTLVSRPLTMLGHITRIDGATLARGFALNTMATQFAVLLIGLPIAAFWQFNPWLTVAALAPLVLVHKALNVPDLEKEARTDTKTGLHNMRSFNEALSRELQRAARFGHPVSVLMVDVDLLRHVNNSYGHQFGDALLLRIAEALQSQIREYDIAARFGGDEFIVLLVECDSDSALQVAERMRRMIEGLRHDAPTSLAAVEATVSIGAASFPRHGTTMEDLIYQADLAVYRAKLGGRNRVCLAPPPNRAIRVEAALDTLTFGGINDFDGAGDLPALETMGGVDQSPATEAKSAEIGRERRRLGDSSFWLQILMSLVIALAGIMVVVSLPLSTNLDWIGLAGLVMLTLAAEAWVVDIYGDSSVSLMVIPILAGAMLFGVAGGAIIGLTAAVSRGVLRRSQFHRVAFNAAVFVLGASIASVIFRLFAEPLQLVDLPRLLLPAVASALVYYVINTALIATAIGLSSKQRPGVIWREQFRWLFVHYAVFGLLALLLAAAYTGFGLYGLLAFGLPAFAQRYTIHQYISNTTEHVSELRRLNAEMKRSNDEMARINEDLLNTLAAAIDVRDPFVYGHSTKVAEYAVAIAEEMHLSGELIELIRQAALLHDIGKLGIAEAILHKPAKLEPDEYEQVKTHSVLGADLLSNMRRLQHLIPAIKHHHEWYDGNGYPGGLAGTEIPVEARILAVCDAIEAMASDRPYHKAMPEDQIIRELQRCSGGQFDPFVVQAFVRVARAKAGMVSNSAQAIRQREGHVLPVNGVRKHALFAEEDASHDILFGSPLGARASRSQATTEGPKF